MTVDLGVYVSTLNEEVLIEACLKNLVKVFPQTEVIDLGSTDRTIEIVRSLGVPINHHVLPQPKTKHGYGPNEAWTHLKNAYKDKHEWIFLIDGDEIFDEENLLKLKAKLENNPKHTAYYVGWRMVRETKSGVQKSGFRLSGTKLFKCSDYVYKRAWPREVLHRAPGVKERKEPKRECDIWCWHGVLLQRSVTIRENTGRYKKRLERAAIYERELEWEDTYKWPWETKND